MTTTNSWKKVDKRNLMSFLDGSWSGKSCRQKKRKKKRKKNHMNWIPSPKTAIKLRNKMWKKRLTYVWSSGLSLPFSFMLVFLLMLCVAFGCLTWQNMVISFIRLKAGNLFICSIFPCPCLIRPCSSMIALMFFSWTNGQTNWTGKI